MSLAVGDLAPEFDVTAHDGRRLRLADYRGSKNVVLYFYPKDETAGCTAEACGFRDAYEELSDKQTEVIGVSYDSTASHTSFARNHRLPFPLVADTDRKLAKAYGADSFFGSLLKMPSRVTFVIGTDGRIAGIFRGMLDIEKHVGGVRRAISALDPRSARLT